MRYNQCATCGAENGRTGNLFATGESGPAADWRQAARAFLDARGFAPGSPFRAIAEALADGFAASPAPFRLPLALELFGEQGQNLGLAERDGPSGFADVRRAVAAVAVEFPQATAEHVRVALNMLAQGRLLESAYREIDPATGAATDVPAGAVVALLRRAHAAGPDAATAGERLARIVLDRRPAVTDVPCPVCKTGTIRWAEVGNVPGHRVCDACQREFIAGGNADRPTLVAR